MTIRLPILPIGVGLLLVILLSACGPIEAQDIAAVTPLPEGTRPATVTPQPAATAAAVVAQAEPTATPTPLNVQLPAGSAAAIAMATDMAMQPEVDNPLVFDSEPVPITFDEFYAGFDMRRGLTLTDKLLSLDGKEVVMQGYMAPPLKPELDWFVLTSIRLEFCPFCSSLADWPSDIAVVYLTDGVTYSTLEPLQVRGRMEIGRAVDPETGMISLVRIYADEVKILS
jgi:hypothetical protein